MAAKEKEELLHGDAIVFIMLISVYNVLILNLVILSYRAPCHAHRHQQAKSMANVGPKSCSVSSKPENPELVSKTPSFVEKIIAFFSL